MLPESPIRSTRSGDCWFCTAVTGALLALAMALELTGPSRPFLFTARLPALILVVGVGWAASRRRWGGENIRPSVPMATPCLILSLTAGVSAATVKLVSVSPVLACVVLSVASACCYLAVGLLIAGGRRGSAARVSAVGPVAVAA